MEPHQATVHYLFVKDVAKVLRVCPDTVRKRIKAGEIPYIRIANMYKIPVSYLGWIPPQDRYPMHEIWVQLELW